MELSGINIQIAAQSPFPSARTCNVVFICPGDLHG
jgi:hypothetical protein